MKCIVNVTDSWGIGYQNELCVRISADMKRFAALTTGGTVVLGRKTMEGFPGGRPLKNRRNIVLSQNPDLQIPGAEIAHSLEELAVFLEGEDPNRTFLIGGERIYRLLLPYCSEALVTLTPGTYPADRFFPNLKELPNWNLAEVGEIQEEKGVKFQYLTYFNAKPLPLLKGDESTE